MASRKDIRDKPMVYSWATKVDFMLNSAGGFKDLSDANVCLLWDQDYILTLERRKVHPQLENAGAAGYRLTIDATDTASDAENLGTRLAYALLNVAIERQWGMSLSWPDSSLPCRVIDRTASTGSSVEGFGSTTSHVQTNDFVAALEKGFEHHSQVPYSLLLSMELCASSRFENNNRSKLILLVSAFEAVARQQDLSRDLGPLVVHLRSTIEKFGIEDAGLKASLLGQVEGLKRESVRRAICRLLIETSLSKEDRDFVDETYQARSKIVHEGHRVPELDAMTAKLDALLRQVYREISPST
jgi:hypothetical protein